MCPFMCLLPLHINKKINLRDKNNRFRYCGLNVMVVVDCSNIFTCKNRLLSIYILNNFFHAYNAKLLAQYHFYRNMLIFNIYWYTAVLVKVVVIFFSCNASIISLLLRNYNQQRIIVNFTDIGYKFLEKFNFFFFRYFFFRNPLVKKKNFRNFR